MASYRAVLQLIQKGCPLEEIIRTLLLRPSQLKRLLQRKRFREALEMQESLAVVMAIHEVSIGVHGAVGRLNALMRECDKPETVRKVCLALLREGLGRCQEIEARRKLKKKYATLQGDSGDRGESRKESGENSRNIPPTSNDPTEKQ